MNLPQANYATLFFLWLLFQGLFLTVMLIDNKLSYKPNPNALVFSTVICIE